MSNQTSQKVYDYLDHPPQRYRQHGYKLLESENGNWVKFSEMDLYMLEGGQLMQQMAEKHDKLEFEIGKLRAASGKYGKHVETCDAVLTKQLVLPCNCGFSDTL